MRKTNKADVTKKLEAHCNEVQVFPDTDQYDLCHRWNGILQALDKAYFSSFDDLGTRVLQRIRMLMTGELSVASETIVFDKYQNTQFTKLLE